MSIKYPWGERDTSFSPRPLYTLPMTLFLTGLFSGIGGLELGFTLAGFTPRLMCELEPSAATVLRRHFPRARLHTDVRTLRNLPPAHVLVAGPPCQDFSQAGTGLGLHGERSGLISEVIRIAPLYETVVIENVPNMIFLHRGAAMEFLAAAFERMGYSWAYRILDSNAFVPQRRERVFFIASRRLDPRWVIFPAPPAPLAREDGANGFYYSEGLRGLGWAPDAIPPLKAGSKVGGVIPPAIIFQDGRVCTPDLRDAERLQGFPPDWTSGLSPRARWRAVGNAVNVCVSRWVAQNIISRRPPVDLEVSPIQSSWPRAAFNVGAGRKELRSSAQEPYCPRPRLHEFLQFPPAPLSKRAAFGFLERARRSRLRLPQHLLERIEAFASIENS